LKKLLADFKTLYRKQQVLEQTSCALPYHTKNPAGAGQADCGWFRLKFASGQFIQSNQNAKTGLDLSFLSGCNFFKSSYRRTETTLFKQNAGAPALIRLIFTLTV
jgi:hypothetical protein